MSQQLRKDNKQRLKGLEIFEVKPVILGGNPNDLKNKVFLNRQQHFEAVRYWNKVIKELRQTDPSTSSG
jgi:hypothetical protein